MPTAFHPDYHPVALSCRTRKRDHAAMAGSRYAYVRNFELPDRVLPNVYMVVRIDGKGFHKFSEQHGFAKPNDGRALELMNAAARHVVESLRPEITLAFAESDEYSFLLRKECELYKRRQSKLVTHIVSLFTSAYVFFWQRYLPHTILQTPPSFDGRLIVYPSEKEVRDYFAWRQTDTHINNLYNTTFWALVLQGSMSEREAHKMLEGTVSSQKNDILFERFGINYNQLPAMFRKGTTLAWDESVQMSPSGEAAKGGKAKARLRTLHIDIIGGDFWREDGPPAHQQSNAAALDAASASRHQNSSASQSASEPWMAPDRLATATGLGFRALR